MNVEPNLLNHSAAPHPGGVLIIQVLFVAFSAYAMARTFLRFKRRTISPSEWLIWSGFWLAVAIAVLNPGLTQKLANFLGVGRGADAVFYLGIVTLSYGFFRLYLRSRHVEQQLTLLVRRLAIEQRRAEERRS